MIAAVARALKQELSIQVVRIENDSDRKCSKGSFTYYVISRGGGGGGGFQMLTVDYGGGGGGLVVDYVIKIFIFYQFS